VYREGGLCQFFHDPSLWSDVGYELESGELEYGKTVRLARRKDCSPDFFEDFVSAEESVESHVFPDPKAQTQWVVRSIKKNLSSDELDADDILVIFPDAYTVRKDAAPLIAELARQGIDAHIVGVTSSRDQIFVPDSVAISGIHRAKGNEAPMVYVLNSQYCWGGPSLIRRRNTLFTAVTRSRAWVRICGWGERMERLKDEIDEVIEHKYKLEFRVPTIEELEKIRKIHRDMTSDERRVINEAEDALSEFLHRVESGDLSIEHLPLSIRKKLREKLTDLKEDDS
jgi:superfamily I DNA and RNA helicase